MSMSIHRHLPPATGTGPLVVVDDDELEIKMVELYLKRSGVSRDLQSFKSGPAFLDHLGRVESGEAPMPAAVLLDVRMPVMDGFEVLSAVRAREPFQRVPLLLMFSNSKDEKDVRRAHELGADAYQAKPANKEEYMRFFRALFAEDG